MHKGFWRLFSSTKNEKAWSADLVFNLDADGRWSLTDYFGRLFAHGTGRNKSHGRRQIMRAYGRLMMRRNGENERAELHG